MITNPSQINQKYQEFECQSYAFAFNNKMDIYSKKTRFLQIKCTNFSRQVNFKSVMGCDDDVIVDRQM